MMNIIERRKAFTVRIFYSRQCEKAGHRPLANWLRKLFGLGAVTRDK